MALQKAISLDCNDTHDFKEKSKVTGYYLGAKKIPNDLSKTGFSFLHILRPKGSKENVGVWGSAQLDSVFSTLAQGTYTEVEFLRKENIGKGRTKKIFDIAFDPEDRLEGISAPAVTAEDLATESTTTTAVTTEAVNVDEAEAILKNNA